MRAAAASIAVILVASGRAAACDVRIEAAWIPEPPPRATTAAGYATLVNTTGKPQRIVGIESSAAGMVMLHETMLHGDMATMRDLPELAIPAGGKLELAPNGKHVMLMGVKTALKAGDHVRITLTDASGCRISGDFAVRPR